MNRELTKFLSVALFIAVIFSAQCCISARANAQAPVHTVSATKSGCHPPPAWYKGCYRNCRCVACPELFSGNFVTPRKRTRKAGSLFLHPSGKHRLQVPS